MSPTSERIIIKDADASTIERLGRELSISPALARALAVRGLSTFEECRSFFRPSVQYLNDPFAFSEMEKAVQRIVSAIAAGEKITVYGDYDADGVTATALLVRALRICGASCDYYLPNRLTEGYGLSDVGVRAIAAGNAKLMITVDCGVTAVSECELARSLGLDVIVTDHHEPKNELPGVVALLNPSVDTSYPYRYLAGVGVAFKLCQALAVKTGRSSELWLSLVDLVALGTAADIVPLTGENRVIVTLGLERLRATTNKGLCALMEVQGLTGKDLSTSEVVFMLAPCINAAGRLGDPRIGVELLLTDDPEIARSCALQLKQANIERRAIDKQVKDEALAWVRETCNMADTFGIVAAQQSWHPGVVGIVASKVVEAFNRPTILFSVGEDGMAKGSGRSIPAVHLLDALDACGDLLESFGGHAAAAGMSIRVENIPAFRERFNTVIKQRVTPDDLLPTVCADAEITLDMVDRKFVNILRQMEPFGPGNMRPVFLCRSLSHKTQPRMVGGSHVKMNVASNGIVMDAIAFGFGSRLDNLRDSRDLALAFSIEENEWNGTKRLQMNVKGALV